LKSTLEKELAIERFRSLHRADEFFLIAIVGIAISATFSYYDSLFDPSQFIGFVFTRWFVIILWGIGISLYLSHRKYKQLSAHVINSGLFVLYVGWSVTNSRIPTSPYYSDVQITTLIILITLLIANRMNLFIFFGSALVPYIIESMNYSGSSFIELTRYLYFHTLSDKILIGVGIALMLRYSTLKYLFAELRYERAVSSRDYLFNILHHDIANSLFVTNIKLTDLKAKEPTIKSSPSLSGVEDSINNTIGIIQSARKLRESLSLGNFEEISISALKLAELIQVFCDPIITSKYQKLNIKINGNPRSQYFIDVEPFIYNVIGNLVGNASKFSEPNSNITIEFNCTTPLEVTITDEGGGFKQLSSNGVPIKNPSFIKKNSGHGLKIAIQTMTYLNGVIHFSNTVNGAKAQIKLLDR
jgi:signal transduction histidine kinase